VLVSLLAVLPLLAGGWLWLRDSSLVAVRTVRVSGLHGAESGEIEAALVRTARQMSTLDVHPSALIAAVAPFRVVRAVHVSASFPHGMSIQVVEQLPVASVQLGAIRTAVAADGAVLGPALLSRSLPAVSAGSESASQLAFTGQYVRSRMLAGELTVLGAEPAPFRRVVSRVFMGSKGITVALHDGLLAYFGDATLPHAKWISLARVLLDESSAGATYIDVRVPERPAAGFPAGASRLGSGTAGTEGTSSTGPASATEPTTAAELAAGLAAALDSTSSSGSSTPHEGPTAGADQGRQSPSESTEAASQGSSQTTPTGASEATVTSPASGG
jgi:cell division protein FtsQ